MHVGEDERSVLVSDRFCLEHCRSVSIYKTNCETDFVVYVVHDHHLQLLIYFLFEKLSKALSCFRMESALVCYNLHARMCVYRDLMHAHTRRKSRERLPGMFINCIKSQL